MRIHYVNSLQYVRHHIPTVGNHATRNLHAGNNELGLMVIYYVTNRNISVDPDTEAGGMTMKRATTLFLIILLLIPILPIVEARDPDDVVSIIEDGYILRDGGGDTRINATNNLYTGTIIGDPDYYRSYIEFNISGIPNTAIIDRVDLVYQLATASTFDMLIRDMEFQPSISTDGDIFGDAGNGTIYYTNFCNYAINTWLTITLTGAETDLEANLAVDWFAVGTQNAGAGQRPDIKSSETTYDPYLKVYYHLITDYEFGFTDSYFENGTVTTGVIVTASDSFSEQFNNSGGPTQYYPTMPSHFTWSIGGGITRTVHVVDEEDITVTLPDGIDYVYTFTIRDFTGKTGIGQSYLEAWRVINGVDTVIERMPIQQPNTVPLNLVYGKTYRLRILYADGSRYDWGYFVAGATSSLTLTIRATEFTDQVQIIYNDIFVEATRSATGLNITVNYNDTRTNTIWANVTIRVRGGAVVVTQDYAIDSFTLDWNAANASLGYVVTVQGLHDDYGTWGYSRIFDQSETFDDAPDLTGIFDFGLTGDVGAWVISFLVLLTFSKAMKARAVIAMVAMLTLLRYIGWSTAPWAYFYGYWLIAILISAGTGGGE